MSKGWGCGCLFVLCSISFVLLIPSLGYPQGILDGIIILSTAMMFVSGIILMLLSISLWTDKGQISDPLNFIREYKSYSRSLAIKDGTGEVKKFIREHGARARDLENLVIED